MLPLPTALLSPEGDFVGWGLWGLWCLFCLTPASVHEMYKNIGKSCGVSLGPSCLVAPFCILLRRLKCGPFQDLPNRICLQDISNLISYCIISWAIS